MTTRLFLVRHGETDSNAEGRAQGRRDVPLNARGREQAVAVASALESAPTAILSSPASRCRETAAPLAATYALPVRIDPRLVEIDFGDLDGLTPPEFAALAPEFLARWRVDDPEDLRMPGGETMGEVRERMLAVARELAVEFDGEAVVVVSHQLALKALLSHALGAPLAAFRGLQLDPASLSVVDVRLDAPWTVLRLNERCPVVRVGS